MASTAELSRAIPLDEPSARGTRIVWLAAADARGHLMRAHLVAGVLEARGATIEVVTTSDAGRRFLAQLGTTATVLSRHYAVQFDESQNIDRRRSDACVARYLVDPRRGARDALALRRLARRADLLINDFHPLPLLLPRGLGTPVVHVYGTHLWQAIARQCAAVLPSFLTSRTCALLEQHRDRALGCLEHSLCASKLPPVVAPPSMSAQALRRALGLTARAPLAAVYLNPHFRDPRIADAIERGLAGAGFAMYAVGEGFAGRPGWRAVDASFTAAAAAADVLISAPGMGALAAWSCFRTPFLALVTDQPEQAENARDLSRVDGAPSVVLPVSALAASTVARAVATLAVSTLHRPDPAIAARAVCERWADAVIDQVARARRGSSPTTR